MKRLGKMQTRNLRPSIGIAGAGLLMFAILAFAPAAARGHGELLIQIVNVTQRIKAATNNPAALYVERGELHRQHREWDAAESDYARAARLDSTLAEVDFCRAKMLDDSGQGAAAEALFGHVIARDPAHAEAFIGRARARMKLGRLEQAISDYQRGLDLHADPKVEYFLELERAFEEQGQPQDALKTLDQGMARLGSNIPLQSQAIELELTRTNIESALLRLDSIIGQSARKERWLARRGEILAKAGRIGEARSAYNSVLTAISVLPWRIQQSPPMQDLAAQIQCALAHLAEDFLPSCKHESETRTIPRAKMDYFQDSQIDPGKEAVRAESRFRFDRSAL